MNTFGRLLRLTTWGESHGEAIGAVLDGFPAGFVINMDIVQEWLDRRAPGQSPQTSPRREADKVEFLSGIFEGKTTGSPISFIIRNTNQQSKDYEALRNTYRPGHADWTYEQKYGHRDHRGGGRASARETAMRIVAGALASQWLEAQYGIKIYAYANQIGIYTHPKYLGFYPYTREQLEAARHTLLRCPNERLSIEMIEEIDECREQKDSVGGMISCIAYNVPIGLGEPIYDKLEARLGYAMLSINACCGFEMGDGFRTLIAHGHNNNDQMYRNEEGKVCFYSNYSGGVLGGISTGQDLRMRAVFKPTSSIPQEQKTLAPNGEIGYQTITIEGRHDPCVIPRAIQVVEAMCALVLMDMLLLSRSTK